MNRFITFIAAGVLVCTSFTHAQMMPPPPQDTTLGNTETAAKAALWLRNLALPTGAGGIGAGAYSHLQARCGK